MSILVSSCLRAWRTRLPTVMRKLRARQRDIFPLPYATAHEGIVDGGSLSRSQKRKAASHSRRDEWCADGIYSMNQLIGSYSNSKTDSDRDEVAGMLLRNQGQALCIDRIREAYAAVPPPPAGLTPAQAFSCLRGSSTGYNPVPLQGTRVSFNLELCSMPPPLNCAHPVVDSLAGQPKEEIDNWRTRILKPESARDDYMNGTDRIRPYLDPQLVRDPKVYAKFLQRLDAAGILTWKTGIRSWLGVFFVAKKNGKLRIILDTRDVNGVFAPPPYTGLPTAAAEAIQACAIWRP